MKEYGSDFHSIDGYMSRRAHLTNVYDDAYFMADGRQCIVALIRQYGWTRIWMPEYFCYEVIESLRQMTNIEILFYQDYPTYDARGTVATLPYRDGDVLLRVNYFGIRDFRSEKDIPVPVIEDHTHDLLGHWSLYSEADWCIASLRKTIPIPEGGMMWSPKGHRLEYDFAQNADNEYIACQRWGAMDNKTKYLQEKKIEKDEFRKVFMDTEEWFDHAEPSTIDERSMDFVGNLDINLWYNAKRRNWRLLCQLVNTKASVLQPDDESCNMFSFIILAKNKAQRDEWRTKLIERDVYPAILWNIPEKSHTSVKDMSQRMLSIHCDGRYTADEIEQMAKIINQVLV